MATKLLLYGLLWLGIARIGNLEVRFVFEALSRYLAIGENQSREVCRKSSDRVFRLNFLFSSHLVSPSSSISTTLQTCTVHLLSRCEVPRSWVRRQRLKRHHTRARFTSSVAFPNIQAVFACSGPTFLHDSSPYQDSSCPQSSLQDVSFSSLVLSC